jgi:CRP-like cAMP-binding protein
MDRGRIEALQATAMFGAVDDEVAAFVLEGAGTRSIARGSHFFRQGDRGSSAFLLERGAVSVVKEWGDERRLLRHLHAGDCFGEVALLDFGARSASVVADEDCAALEITAPLLRRIGRQAPQQFALIYMNLGRELGRRLRDADERLFRSHVAVVPGDVAEGYAFTVI